MTKLFVTPFLLLAACLATHVQTVSGTEWKLIQMNDMPLAILEKPVTLTISEDGKQVTGFGGCNRYFGGVSFSGQSFKVGQIGATKMYCQETTEIEDTYFRNLQDVDGYRTKGNVLELLSGEKVLLTFTR